ncbi:NAD(P)H-dependent oxidoreductase [Fulvivirga sp. 29W222]|uniref:NAD(P)H-dependent oxidoreductase n=1 Tax=Fulvivirga marina TaxID=2494733 RepID=A0A937KGH0_9BACT|nr:NAD(P)H-dependent oxidoreductase [Fulvivirga marina]MBL6449405.1 NAD(P)H-dependent oxidoreductase [Fulvivirga marina]
MQLIKDLEWRYATKKFDSSKKVSDADLETIKRAVQLSASSYGLQLYKVLIIEDMTLREKLKPASWGQSQITEASHLFVFCSYTYVHDNHINDYMKLHALSRKVSLDTVQGYGNFIKEKIAEKSETERQEWMVRQTYLALGNLLSACAALKIDTCPMEGFEADKYNEILGLTEEGLHVSVIAPIGYRAADDKAQLISKTRKPFQTLFETR